MVFALALATLASAMIGRSVAMLELARADLSQNQAEYLMDGAHFAAAATVVRAGEGGPYRWAFPSDAGFVEALAESEANKLSPQAGSVLPDSTFAAMGVRDAAAIKARLSAVPLGDQIDVAAIDPAPLWRDCAPSLISGSGRAETPPPSTTEPRPRPETPDWRVGELWRIRITTSAGWRDDRIVRFTGDARHPVAVVRRRLSRGDGGQGRCDAVLAAAA